jgi:hypothetical protein
MSLTLGDVEGFDENHIEVFQNYSEPIEVPPLEDAYQGLLEQRNTLLIPVANSTVKMTEDDLLVNTNLHTASLFNRLNDEFKKKQIKLDEYNLQLKNILEIPDKIENHINTLKKIYLFNDIESVESLNTLDEQITRYFKDVNVKTIYIIRKKIMDLEGETEDISRKLNALRSLIVTGVNEIVKQENKEKKMCPVCFDNEVNTALVPCGHTYCKGCSETDRSRYAKCPQCRTQINARIKIFFSI